MSRSLICLTALAAGLVWTGAANAEPDQYGMERPALHHTTQDYDGWHQPRVYRPAPPISGVIHLASRGDQDADYRGDTGYRRETGYRHYGSGPAVYHLHHSHEAWGPSRRFERHAGYRFHAGYAGRGYAGRGYAGRDVPLIVRYGEPPLLPADAVYARQGYEEGGAPPAGYHGIRVYDPAPTEAYPYGPAGGLGVYSPGSFGPGPRVITIPAGYGYAGGQTSGCTCRN